MGDIADDLIESGMDLLIDHMAGHPAYDGLCPYCERKTDTKVVHCKRHKYDVLIDRTTPWGNPFSIGKDGDRNTVLDKYVEWLYDWTHNGREVRIGGFSNKWVISHLMDLRGKRLGCWCVQRIVDEIRDDIVCHGEILLQLVEQWE